MKSRLEIKDKKFVKFVDYTLIAAVLFAVFLWTTVYHNTAGRSVASTAEVEFLDVGQGDAILINLPNSVQALIDGGPDNRVLDQLSRQMPRFDKKIEYVFASHPDADHIGGLPEVLANYQVGEFVETGKTSESQTFKKLASEISQKKIPVKTIRQGDEVDLAGEGKMEVLWPDDEAVKSATTNNASEVTRFSYLGATVLFTGDAEVEAMDKIMASEPADKLKSDILKVSHHGSSTGLDKKFLQEVAAKFAVISVGKDNKYGHPAPSVVAALKDLGASVFRTDEKGTIEFVYKDGEWQKK